MVGYHKWVVGNVEHGENSFLGDLLVANHVLENLVQSNDELFNKTSV